MAINIQTLNQNVIDQAAEKLTKEGEVALYIGTPSQKDLSKLTSTHCVFGDSGKPFTIKGAIQRVRETKAYGQKIVTLRVDESNIASIPVGLCKVHVVMLDDGQSLAFVMQPSQ